MRSTDLPASSHDVPCTLAAAAPAAGAALGRRALDEPGESIGEIERGGPRVGDLSIVEHDPVVLRVVDDGDAAGSQHLVGNERDVGRESTRPATHRL
jgi:hypothetical protein